MTGRGRNEGDSGEREGRSTRARRESSAGGVVFRVPDGGRPLYLLIRDSYGNWGFPKGHLERRERADTAALREVMEETGLLALTLRGAIATIEWQFRFRGALVHKNCQFFLMESATADTRPQQAEGITACQWTPVEEALDLIIYENARAILRRAHEMVAARDTVSASRAE